MRNTLAFTVLLAVHTLLHGGMVDAISMIVDNKPITLYEIYESSGQFEGNKQKAVEFLINKRLKEIEIERLHIYVDPFDVDSEIDTLAKNNGLDTLGLRNAIINRGMDWETYKQEIREGLLERKLYRELLSTKVQPPSDAILEEYYETRQKKFSQPDAVDVIKYAAPDRRTLQQVQINPLASGSVQQEQERVPLAGLNPQFVQLLTQTPKGSFTPILPADKTFVMFYIQGFIGNSRQPFESIKDEVMRVWLEEKRKQAINSHFEKMRSEANIQVLRAP